MNKKEKSIIVAVLVAFLIMAVHHFACINQNTVLLPSNIGIAILFITMILGGCLCVLRKYRHINWKNITFLSVSVTLLVVLILRRDMIISPVVYMTEFY